MAIKEVRVPNIGDAKDVEVIEILVSPGQKINKEDSLITLESAKASMEIPSPEDGIVKEVKVSLNDKISEGSLILLLETEGKEESPKKEQDKQAEKPTVEDEASPSPTPTSSNEAIKTKQAETSPDKESTSEKISQTNQSVHAGPGVRQMAREFGINLNHVVGSGIKNRILKEDLQQYVKSIMQKEATSVPAINFGSPKAPEIDYSKYGEVTTQPLSKIKRLTGIHVHRSWVTIPHVTQFDQADITEMEAFRKNQKASIEKQGIKLTPLVFIMKAVVAALKAFPHFNASLDASEENIIIKKYYNLGIAVDTPNGLVVPVVKNVDQKGMISLAKELGEISQKARQKGLSPADMAGSCFTISSLGGIGGTAFTPIINAPDVAILGVSKAEMKPVFNKDQFLPRLMLPLSLSYDHRVIDGADGARFLVYLANCLTDIRTLLL